MIYCVEDDSGIRELVVYSLENTGFSAKGMENSFLTDWMRAVCRIWCCLI